MLYFWGKKGPWFRIFRLPDIRNYRTARIYRIFTVKFREKFFLFSFEKIRFIKGFRWCWFRIFRYPLHPEYGFPENHEKQNLPGNSGRNYFFSFQEKSDSKKNFDDADSEFCGIRFIRNMVFRKTSQKPNLPGNSGRNYFFSFPYIQYQ